MPKDKKSQKIQKVAYEVIQGFPKAKNGQSFLTLGNGRKLFFNRFILKYGLNGSHTTYNYRDIIRRVQLVEFFDFFIKEFPMQNAPNYKKSRYIIESKFYRMVIVENKVGVHNKLELLSFYPI